MKKQIETERLTPEQIEALIRYKHDPGSRWFSLAANTTESEVELECYVVERELKPTNESEAA